MMKNTIFTLAIPFIITISSFAEEGNIIQASQTETAEENKVLLAANISVETQQLMLDSLILQDLEFAEADTVDLYWNNFVVNPYKTDLMNMKDTVPVDCSGFYPPIEDFYITSKFGFRKYRFHYGTDFKINVGDTIRAAFDGKVRIAKYNKGGYGYYVLLRHPNGLETIYGHLSRILTPVDTDVKAGDAIGLGGNTGRSTGPHLHFEARYLGNAIDPMTMFDFEQQVPYDDYFIVCAQAFEYKKEINKIRYHKVRSGDTLSGIAKRYGTSISKLQQLNKMGRSTLIRLGQMIRYT